MKKPIFLRRTNLKRLLWVTVATLLFTFQLGIANASAYELEESVRTVPLNEGGEEVVFSTKQLDQGQRLFRNTCSKCHAAGRTKTNPNVTLNQEALEGAEPRRDNVLALVDYMENPTSYDGEIDLKEIHPNTSRSDIWLSMRNLTEEDLEDIAGHILVQQKILGKVWGGGKVYN
ncbi:MAG: photosystem II cytochrome c-550 [Spirulinaceae cyanobacterium]